MKVFRNVFVLATRGPSHQRLFFEHATLIPLPFTITFPSTEQKKMKEYSWMWVSNLKWSKEDISKWCVNRGSSKCVPTVCGSVLKIKSFQSVWSHWFTGVLEFAPMTIQKTFVPFCAIDFNSVSELQVHFKIRIPNGSSLASSPTDDNHIESNNKQNTQQNNNDDGDKGSELDLG